jgi:hypothetical protein
MIAILQDLSGGFTVLDPVDRIGGVFQGDRDGVTDHGVIFYQQDAHCLAFPVLRFT